MALKIFVLFFNIIFAQPNRLAHPAWEAFKKTKTYKFLKKFGFFKKISLNQ